MLKNGDHEGRIFLSHPMKNSGLFFLLTIDFFLLLDKIPEVPDYAEM